MKAWKLSDIGDFEYTDVDIPGIGDNEVLVKVRAAGICGSDIPRVYKDGAHNMPLTIGHEFAGEVADTGKGVPKDWNGKRVGIFPLIPCKECIACKQRKYEMCRNYSYLGSRRDGGFAEYVSVPEWNLIELPDLVDFEVAAMLEPMAVATHAMRRINPDSDNTVVINNSQFEVLVDLVNNTWISRNRTPSGVRNPIENVEGFMSRYIYQLNVKIGV